ncbi:MAG: hypothetical protein JXA03_12775 [Bacteroidales bacterium]|nr:hypothetical protein [Bacteroidales bacterium]
MKKFTTFILACATALFLLLSTSIIRADEPPNPGGGPGSGDLPVGGSSPLGGGLIILVTLGAGYSLRKVFKSNKFE